MNDSKSDNRDIKKELGETNKKRLKILLLVSLSFFIFIVTAAIFRDDGVIKVYHLNKKVELLKNNISKLKKENEKLNSEVYALKNDSSYIEKIAREDLGLVKQDEVVFEFVEKDNKK
ncbi:MAG: septum formation initiator family protein [Nitrospinae bacterium]|nr:septum formation initiator family protein [Nitrospinota bacterium]MBI5749836.1 septum formation initiator family protein [Nitrospinota bacterium]